MSVVAGLLLAALSAPAAAQDTQGPLVLTPVDRSIVVGPDVKLTTVDDATATLVGAYAAKLIDTKVLVGGAGYWLVSPLDHAHLWYGGMLLGWKLMGDNRTSVGVRGLAGFGGATIFRTVTVFARPDFHHTSPSHGGAFTQRVGYDDLFLVGEPEIVANFGVASYARLMAGLGYRFTSAGPGFSDLLHGPTLTISAQFDIGK